MDRLSLGIWLLICFGVATIGGSARPGPWYRGINKPPWNPPDWVFAPVWSLLFIMMAVAAWLVWVRRGEQSVALPLMLFMLQLALNALWSWLFFGFRRPDWAFAEVLVFWLAILATTLKFYPIDRRAAYLMIPYLAWVSFAAYLNWVLWRLNLDTIGRPSA